MSKINAIRLINVNYNNNAYRISDETMYFNGESTLLSLQNGGGKSVLVQMLTAPFVHQRYRNTKDRLFESYFTTNKPSFILVEWVLDQGAGYVLTGLMVRKAQDLQEDKKENLDIIGIVSEAIEVERENNTKLETINKTIPIIAMTANAFSEDIQYSFAAGMNVHISKPVEMKVLEKTIRSIKFVGVSNRRSLNSDK